jgi:hypothetical protein
MVVARPRAAAQLALGAPVALPPEEEVAVARSSVLPEEAVAEEAVAAQPVSAAEVPRQEVAEVRSALAVPQQVEARSALAAEARRLAVAAERLASAERQQEAEARQVRGVRAARLRAAVPSAVAACSCRPAAAPARRRSTRFVPVTARLRIASP